MNSLNDNLDRSEQIISVLNAPTTDSQKLTHLSEIYFNASGDQSVREDKKQSIESSDQISLQVVAWLMSLEEIPDHQMELYCDLGDFLCQGCRLMDEMVFFKIQRLLFYDFQDNQAQARMVLDDLQRLVPNSDFVREWTQKLQPFDAEKFVLELRTETNFSKYLDLVKIAAKRYMVLIAVSDTPWGPHIDKTLTQKLLDLGLKTDLYKKFRCSYASIISQDKCCFEALSVDQPVTYSGQIENIKIDVESRGFNVPPKMAKIVINEKECSSNSRGIHFVVFDRETRTILDSVAFDTFTEALVCSRTGRLAAALADWHKNHPEITLLSYNLMKFPTQNLSAGEKFIQKYLSKGIDDIYRLLHMNADANNPAYSSQMPLRQYFRDDQDILSVLFAPKSYHDLSGVRKFEDFRSPQVNTQFGHRCTTDQPSDWKHTVYLIGGCSVFGVGASDKGTVASHLQRLFNEFFPEDNYVVQNYGYFLCEMDANEMEEMKILESLPVQAGDIVLGQFGEGSGVPFLDLSKEARRPHEYGEIFWDDAHLTEDGYRMVADKLFEYIKNTKKNDSSAKKFSGTKQCSCSSFESLKGADAAELNLYKSELRALYDRKFSVGAVVMNCNPFTLGHRYLIEQASKQCGHLIIFVVEEDSSQFPFEDRLMLVKKGVAGLQNITVMPSGKFIISSLTFSEYFNKSELQDRRVDPSLDLSIFAKEIAPVLHITKRFVGEEPIDTVTNQYNKEMKLILGKSGIEVIEIPRKSTNGTVISASLVRNCLEKGDYASIRELVPTHTYRYLMKTKC